MSEKSVELTVDMLYLLCTILKKEGHGNKVVNVGYDSNCAYTNMGLYSELKIDENEIWIDESDLYDSNYKANNCIEDYIKKYGDINHTNKTLRELDERVARLERIERKKEKDSIIKALNQFRYKEKTEDERKAFCIIESFLNTKW